jgi:hypothetical protein
MSQLSKGIFGVIAVSLTLGVAQLALGHDLAGIQSDPTGTPEVSINRSAKADRISGQVASAAPTRTILLRLDSLTDTSVLLRVPVAKEARNGSFAPSAIKSGDRKTAFACEPVVSVLTEIAKQLAPGRCVT